MTKDEALHIHPELFYGALKNHDLHALEELYSDEYTVVRPDGSVLDKHQVLADLRAHNLTFQSIDLRDARVRLLGSAAIVTGESTTVSFRDGKEAHARLRLVTVNVQEGAAIRLVHFQSTLSD